MKREVDSDGHEHWDRVRNEPYIGDIDGKQTGDEGMEGEEKDVTNIASYLLSSKNVAEMVMRELTYLKQRETRMYSTQGSTANRLIYLTFIGLTFLCVSSYYNLMYLRKHVRESTRTNIRR